MTRSAQKREEFSGLPDCFRKLRTAEAHEIAEEMYDTLRSLQRLTPAQVAGTELCPAVALGERKSNYIVAGVQSGRRFKALDQFNTPSVRFVGVAAGVLEAVRLGAVNPILKVLFAHRVQQLTAALANPRLTALRRRRFSVENVTGEPFDSDITSGEASLEKLHAMSVLVHRAKGVVEVWAFRVIEVSFHPEMYRAG